MIVSTKSLDIFHQCFAFPFFYCFFHFFVSYLIREWNKNRGHLFFQVRKPCTHICKCHSVWDQDIDLSLSAMKLKRWMNSQRLMGKWQNCRGGLYCPGSVNDGKQWFLGLLTCFYWFARVDVVLCSIDIWLVLQMMVFIKTININSPFPQQ